MREAGDHNPASAACIALVDNDELMRESLERHLLDVSYCVRPFCSSRDFLAALADGFRPDVLVLDWKMPEITGIAMLKRLRADNHTVPTIILTDLTDQIYEEAAFSVGAVDFIGKSRSFAIVQWRIQNILANASTLPRTTVPRNGSKADESIGSLEARRATRRAYWKGVQLPFSVMEFDIVYHLASRAGGDVSYRELYDFARGTGFLAGHGTDGCRASVRTHVKRIRYKFRAVDSKFDEIENYHGFGYRWRRSPR